MKAAVATCVVDGFAELMEDLVLSDHDRIAADGDRDRMTDRSLAGEEAAARREPCRRLTPVIGRHEIRLDPMARLENHGLAGMLDAEPGGEALPLSRGNVAGVGDEPDDRVLATRRHGRWSSPAIDEWAWPRRLRPGCGAKATP